MTDITINDWTGSNTLPILTAINLAFIIMHELDAFRKGEWRMFTFLARFGEKLQYNLFLWAHFPLLLFVFYYFWTVINCNLPVLWIAWNGLMVVHLFIHLVALDWKSNVFDVRSFIWIGGAALTGIINILLIITNMPI